MGFCHLRVDLGVLGEGIRLAVDFGLRPLEEMALVAELLEKAVYEPGSLTLDSGQVGFTLRNPPLRMGAFYRLRLFHNGTEVDPSTATVEVDGASPRALATIRREAPVTLPVGRRTRFRLGPTTSARGLQRIRLELQSVAIPPTVWFEFADHVREE